MTTKQSAFGLDLEEMANIERKLHEKRAIAQPRERELFGVFEEALTDEEAWALKYLYAYMPVNDLADYDGRLFLNHVRKTLEIRERMPWGTRVPDRLFLAFVLPYRVNTENIEDSRGLLHAELAERTRKLTMADAILETNYWCHEKAVYIGSDLRTLSPLSMIRNARGRCGEGIDPRGRRAAQHRHSGEAGLYAAVGALRQQSCMGGSLGGRRVALLRGVRTGSPLESGLVQSAGAACHARQHANFRRLPGAGRHHARP